MSRKLREIQGHGGKKIKPSVTPTEESPDKLPPIFSLKIRRDYCITNCTQEERAHFSITLHELSQSSWADLRQKGKRGGYEIIPRSALRRGIPSEISDDVNIIAFRFHDKKPMVGYRDAINRRIFHILWLDRGFSLYDHGS